MTLAELLMAMTVTALLSVVLGGLILAVQTARQHSEGLDTATFQAQAALDRIRLMVADAGVYRVADEPTVLGLAVVTQSWNTDEIPNILVVWSGGRNGGIAATGTQNRLPFVNELVIYAPDPVIAGRLVEIALPNDSSTIDFRASDFETRIRQFVASPSAERIRLCDRIRVCGNPQSIDGPAEAVRFDLRMTPDDSVLEAIAPQTTQWIQSGWAQGITTTDKGLRQATVRVELQLHRTESFSAQVDSKVASIPFFGSASRRYAYER